MNREWAAVWRAAEQGEAAQLRRTVGGGEYVRRFAPPERLILLGGGHVAQAVCAAAAGLGFAVTVVDDRPEFTTRARFPLAERRICDGFAPAIGRLSVRPGDYVCVLTRGHRWDGECLRTLLRGTMPRYLGMMGSRRRVAGLLDALSREGFDRDLLRRIHTPIGLPIGARTPAEIAVSIAAELVQVRHRAAGETGEAPCPAHETGDAACPAHEMTPCPAHETTPCPAHETAEPSCPSHETAEPPVTVLEQTAADRDLLRFLAEGGCPRAFLLVLETHGSAPAPAGSLMAVDGTGRSFGTVGGGCAEAGAMVRARKLLGTGRRETFTADLWNDGTGCGGSVLLLAEDVPEDGLCALETGDCKGERHAGD